MTNAMLGIGGAPTRATTFRDTAEGRKAAPVASGVLDYFPDAIVALAEVSFKGNEQHNPGQPLYWNRSKSGDESDALVRHFLQRGTTDTDGIRHSAKVAWRALALLQKEIEKGKGTDGLPSSPYYGPGVEEKRRLIALARNPFSTIAELPSPFIDRVLPEDILSDEKREACQCDICRVDRAEPGTTLAVDDVDNLTDHDGPASGSFEEIFGGPVTVESDYIYDPPIVNPDGTLLYTGVLTDFKPEADVMNGITDMDQCGTIDGVTPIPQLDPDFRDVDLATLPTLDGGYDQTDAAFDAYTNGEEYEFRHPPGTKLYDAPPGYFVESAYTDLVTREHVVRYAPIPAPLLEGVRQL